jgi:hypothetical protein
MDEQSDTISIWTTIRGFVVEPPDDGGTDIKALRHTVAEYIVGEPLTQVGMVEGGYSFTGVTGAEPIPDAFSIIEDRDELSIVLLVGRLGPRALPTVHAQDIESTVSRAIRAIESIAKGELSIPEAGREGVGEYTSVVTAGISRIRLVSVTVVALGVALPEAFDAREDRLPPITVPNLPPISVRITTVDIPTLQELWNKSFKAGTIDLVFSEFIGAPLKCLRSPDRTAKFETLLAIIPGDVLAKIYTRWNSQVLQKNLRNFLQATGKVNKGIQKTLREQPERFLAYNNGLTITASAVEFDPDDRIVVLKDFQIVNGGQTTASLDYAKRLKGVDLSLVSVQAKITVIDTYADSGFVDDVSNYANSQNKVKLSDFQARDKFQTSLSILMRDNEELMLELEDGQPVYWYYEAFRGGYLTAKYQRSGKKRDEFSRIFPKSQVIDKIELAKIENGWDGYPHLVCRGADKNFTEWVKRTHPQTRPEPDVEYCKRLVSKLIILRETAARVKSNGYSGFKSQITAYAYSYLCFLLERQESEVDLDKVWRSGTTALALGEVLDIVIGYVEKFMRASVGNEDMAQWSKKDSAWADLIDGFENGDYPKVYTRLKTAQLLRPKTFDVSVACGRAIEALKTARNALSKRDLLRAMLIHESRWLEVRRALVENYGVEQVDSRRNAVYRMSEL